MDHSKEDDIMVIRTGLMKGVLGSLLGHLIKKKTGREASIVIDALKVVNDGNEVRLEAQVKATMSSVEFAALMAQSRS